MRAAACRLGMAALDRVTYSARKPPQPDANAMTFVEKRLQKYMQAKSKPEETRQVSRIRKR